MDDNQKLAAEQFANIEIIKFMMLDLWAIYILEKDNPVAHASMNRDRQIGQLQNAFDLMPASVIRSALLDNAQENWVQIFSRIESEGIIL